MQSALEGQTPPRTHFSRRWPFLLNASILVALLAASSAPTPLYSIYQAQWQLSSLTVTVIFSAYALALLIALLTTGTLSDHIGRRPVLITALALQIVSMAIFVIADGAGTLIVARVLQGIATGAATSSAGAALLDLENPARPGSSALANSIAPVAGMATGVISTTALIHLVPGPTVTVYLLLMALFAAQALALAFTPETTQLRPGALQSMRPHLALPPAARRALALNSAGIIAVWALGGFYSSLGPAFTRLISPDGPQSAGGLVFFTLTSTAALTVWATRRLPALTAALLGSSAVAPAMALSITALHFSSPALLFTGAALAGFSFGAVSQGALHSVLATVSAQERSGTLASYYVLSYLAMSLPAIAAGALATRYGLSTTALFYSSTLAILAIGAAAALAAAMRTHPRTAKAAPAAPALTPSASPHASRLLTRHP
ncbi:MFS transporter [Streptomyces sp. NBC_00568]|uniref:MFS transporter n=1 Tax=Streptomyces sp. NBC_00568 TaxID=2975779 RepID=UPI0022581897|nr:MFS transporter [Streptomyces sp. NBC_00568]MCX4993539.1 MFS transporter [Streptomyces sp. NBC_00568]